MQRIVLTLILFCSFAVSGQKFHFEIYSLEKGLPRSGVYHILQDHSGFLWIGTDGGGACKFDGNKFYEYTRSDGLAAEKVRLIFQDDRNVLWFATPEGLSYYDGTTFYTLTVEDGLADNFIRSITQDSEGNIWIGTNRGISIIDPDEKGVSGNLKFNFSLPDKKVRAVYAQDDAVWIGTDNGLCRYINGEIEVFTTKNGLSNNLILYLYGADNGSLWIGTESGLTHYSNEKFESWNVQDGLISERIRSITEDSHGNIWIGTNDGISIFDGKSFINLDRSNGLTNDRIRCVQRDDFDNIWIGTYFGGILRFNHQDFLAFTTKYGLMSNQILSLGEDANHDIVVGTYEGVSALKIDDGKYTGSRQIPLPFELEDHSIKAIHFDENGYGWYGSTHGIFIRKGHFEKHLHVGYGLHNESITVLEEFDSVIWAGTEYGLGMITHDGNYENFKINFVDAGDGLAGGEVSSIVQDSTGNIWVAFSDGGLSLYKNDHFINPILPKNVGEILSFGIDEQGRLWLGTNGSGIFYGTHNPETHKLNLEHLSIANNLSSNYSFSLLFCGDRIWSGHEKGLDLIAAGDSIHVIHSYGPERGFFGLQNNQNATFKDSRGNLWFGTVNGLFFLRKNDFKAFRKGKSSINFIKSIQINGEKINWKESEWCTDVKGTFQLPQKLKLPYDKNNVSFDFIALNFVSPGKVKYSWKLEGFEKRWSSPSSKRYITYTNLDPGKYTFKLKTSNEHGVFIDDPISFSFSIEKPFWDLWSFRIAVVILGVLIFMAFSQLRTRQLRKKKKELEAIIAARTEEITKKNDVLEQQKVEIENQNTELVLKNTEITDSIYYSRRIQYSILPGSEKVSSILNSYFILYKPKDIVSGDFYWVERSFNNPKMVHFSVADCTGHGVPGAMVSLIGTRALNSSIIQHKLSKASDILEKTNDIVIEAFTDDESGKIIKDGMDLGLCSLDYSHKDGIGFQYCGAQNPAYIVRKEDAADLTINGSEMTPSMVHNGFKLFEIKGTKQPVGHFENRVPFENNEGILQIGDRIYLSSDGYADQFGGEKGKKFKYKNLKKLILELQHKPLKEQDEMFRQRFRKWKGELEQLDDICVMGVEV